MKCKDGGECGVGGHCNDCPALGASRVAEGEANLTAVLGRILEELADRLQARADNAYTEYIGQCRRDECLEWEIKVEHGKFGFQELHAHKEAAITLGRNRALHEAVVLVRESLCANV